METETMGDVFGEVADLLFGGGADELIAKMNPTQSDLATSDRKKRGLTAGLSAVGGVAGAAGLGLAATKTHGAYKVARAANLGRKAAFKAATEKEKLATGLIPLEVAGLGGEVLSTKILHNDSKRGTLKPAKIKKDIGEIVSQTKVPSKRNLTMAVLDPQKRAKGMEYTKKTHGALRRLPAKVVTTNKVEKAEDGMVDVTWTGEISKAVSDKQQIFGWASVVEVNGEPVVDLQGDHISPEEMEKAAYTYVQKSRKGGDMHLQDNWSPIQKSEMIESFIVTPDKREAMGLPDTVPTGWWVGFQVQDPEVWAKVKSGERTGFSIHGRGKRTAL
jgi:hypothetical protein